MQVDETIQCPFCGQSFSVAVDTSIEDQQFTTDCEICCHPMEIHAECQPGEIIRLEIMND